MPKKGGPGSRKSVRVEEKAALEAEQAAAVVDAQSCPWRIELAPRFRGASRKKKPKSPFYEERASTFCPPKKI